MTIVVDWDVKNQTQTKRMSTVTFNMVQISVKRYSSTSTTNKYRNVYHLDMTIAVDRDVKPQTIP